MKGQKQKLIAAVEAQKEIMILNGLMEEISPDIPDDLFNRYCVAVDAINETADDYMPTEAEVQTIIELQAEAKEAIQAVK